jgi:hypothetical protein
MKLRTLGDGQLYVVHRFKDQLLVKMEQRRAYLMVCGIIAAAMINALIWILR